MIAGTRGRNSWRLNSAKFVCITETTSSPATAKGNSGRSSAEIPGNTSPVKTPRAITQAALRERKTNTAEASQRISVGKKRNDGKITGALGAANVDSTGRTTRAFTRPTSPNSITRSAIKQAKYATTKGAATIRTRQAGVYGRGGVKA